MSDQIHLSGPDANLTRDDYLAIVDSARKLDPAQILSLLSEVFVKGPEKTIDELSDEEIVRRKYRFEATIIVLRAHLNTVNQEADKRRRKVGDKIFKDLDANYKPKRIPETKKANNSEHKLAAMLAEEMNISIEDALEIMKKKG